VTYGYSPDANLTEVDEPGNNTAAKLIQNYGFYPGGHMLQWAASPRWVASGSNHTDGGYLYFTYYPWNGIAQIDYYGTVNMAIADGYSTGVMQPGAAGGIVDYRTVRFDLNGYTTNWHDTDGHQSVYTYDTLGRVTQTQATTGDPTGGATTLTSTQAWDSANNLVSATDPRGNTTNYAYDAMGNTIAVAQPAASAGQYRPTSLYSYDANNNLTAYCDPVWANANGKNWASPPAISDSLCPNQSGTTRYAWAVPAGGYEPSGELSSTTTPRVNDTLMPFFKAYPEDTLCYGCAK